MKKLLKRKAVLLLAVLLLLEGCAGTQEPMGGEENQAADETVSSVSVEKETANAEDYKIKDNPQIYADDDETSVVTMYLTVRRGNEAENTNHTWTEVNTFSKYYYEDNNIPQYAVEGILQVGDENGPLPGELGYGLNTPNAIIKIRGQTSTKREQKNYKIELKDEKETWRDQRTINLNKHVGDGSRFSNKLAYDLMKEIPQMMSVRTQFVHLYVKDETEGADAVFQDYGLFTQVEQINKKYLSNHNLDKNGHLYKINFFEYFRYDDVIKLATDPGYDQKAFETYLEIKGDNDHTKLIAMLDAVNDYAVPIEDTVKKWFDEENLMYWLGFHILMGNVDTNARNYFLYSPLNVDRFYIISWDNDAALKRDENILRQIKEGDAWQQGISNYWGNVLYQRMFKSKEYRDKLTEAIEDLRANYLTLENVTAKITEYREVVKPYVYSMPDLINAPLTETEYEEIAAAMPKEIEENYNRYLESLQKPMPFYIGVPEIKGDSIKFNWDAAYDFDNENITYSFELSDDYTFANPIKKENAMRIPEVELPMLEPGQYFIRVIATNESGKSQTAFDYYVIDDGKEYGVKCFYVLPDGTIGEDNFYEGE